jgi:hypothetical protein
MPIPPLGEMSLANSAPAGFEIMNRLSLVPQHNRIENLSLSECSDLERSGFVLSLKSWDYLYDRRKMVDLKGNRYKGKRVSYNSVTKRHQPEYLPFSLDDLSGCLDLYDQWMAKKRRKITREEEHYQVNLMEDSRKAHRRMMEESDRLGLVGRVARVDSEIKGYLFGVELNAETIGVIAEVTEISIKGLAQYIFRKFCEEMVQYRWVNVMDDSGLPSLRNVKESYYPDLLAPAYILNQRISS